jgi:chromosome partitioning protein
MIITVYNDKGGSGKTPLTAAIASWSAHQGHRVLLVDLDPQAALTTWADPDPNTIYLTTLDVLTLPPAEQALRRAIVPTGPGWPDTVDILPATSDLNDLENAGDLPNLEGRLAHVLTHQLAGYDLTVIDAPPTRGRLPKNAIRAAQRVLIPAQTEPTAGNSVGKALGLIDELAAWGGPTAVPVGIVPTRFDQRQGTALRVLDDLQKEFSDNTVPLLPPIKCSTMLSVAQEQARALEMNRPSDDPRVFHWLDTHLPKVLG